MADTYEKDLGQKSSLTTSDYIRVVGSDNVSYKQLVSDVAKKIIEDYTGSSLAGSSQSVKSALDALNSKYTSYNASLTLSSTGNASLESVIGHSANTVPVMGYVSGDSTSVKIVSFARFNGGWYAHVETAAGVAVSGAVNVTIITLSL